MDEQQLVNLLRKNERIIVPVLTDLYKKYILKHVAEVRKNFLIYAENEERFDIELTSMLDGMFLSEEFINDSSTAIVRLLESTLKVKIPPSIWDHLKDHYLLELVLTVQLHPTVIDTVKGLLKNFYQDKLDSFNQITGRRYSSISEIQSRVSALICGHIYQLLPEALQQLSRIRQRGRLQNVVNTLLSTVVLRFRLTDQFAQENFNCSLAQLKDALSIQYRVVPTKQLILPNDYKELFDYFYTMCEETCQNNRTDRKKYLLELDNDNRIGQFYGAIDYDAHDLDKRDAPIVVYRSFSEDGSFIDKVLIGKYGQSHHQCIIGTDRTIYTQCKKDGKVYLSECYFYEPCAFVDTTNHDFTIDEVVSILKKDPRIKKVYLSPGSSGGELKRLARKYKKR